MSGLCAPRSGCATFGKCDSRGGGDRYTKFPTEMPARHVAQSTYAHIRAAIPGRDARKKSLSGPLSTAARRSLRPCTRRGLIPTGDFSRQDLVAPNRFSDSVSVLLGNGDGTFQATVNFSVGSGSIAAAAGDFNTDGWLDLVLPNHSSDNVSVLIANMCPAPPSWRRGCEGHDCTGLLTTSARAFSPCNK